MTYMARLDCPPGDGAQAEHPSSSAHPGSSAIPVCRALVSVQTDLLSLSSSDTRQHLHPPPLKDSSPGRCGTESPHRGAICWHHRADGLLEPSALSSERPLRGQRHPQIQVPLLLESKGHYFIYSY